MLPSLGVLCLCGLLTSSANGFLVDYTFSPSRITFPITEELRMRCALSNPSSDEAEAAPADVPQTSEKLQHATSIVVTRGGTHVAQINQYEGVEIFADHAQLKVTGDVHGSNATGSYLEMVWSYPNPAQDGTYKCEFNAINEYGHNVVLSKSLVIKNVIPTIQDIGLFVQQDRKKIKQLQTTVSQLLGNLALVSNRLTTLEAGHTETGTGYCPDSSRWTKRNSRLEYEVSFNFTTSYDRTPEMSLGLTYVSTNAKFDGNVGVELAILTPTGFTVRCYQAGQSQVHGARFQWLSTP